ncbi:hypothetical protein EYC80_002595 [Monilinia laxa]|uniref:Uncharacterized protein n=1 Tax=Monilinia laxa TaxID=61186 RepID=A0A5N6K547_MONLA|nr:hypothetical protein EYC80_002595 [Monilinia laxa]
MNFCSKKLPGIAIFVKEFQPTHFDTLSIKVRVSFLPLTIILGWKYFVHFKDRIIVFESIDPGDRVVE